MSLPLEEETPLTRSEKRVLWRLCGHGLRPRRGWHSRLNLRTTRLNRWLLRERYPKSPELRHVLHYMARHYARTLKSGPTIMLLAMSRGKIVQGKRGYTWTSVRLSPDDALKRIVQIAANYGYRPPPTDRELLKWGRQQIKFIKAIEKMRKTVAA